jgi:hypothetical protein
MRFRKTTPALVLALLGFAGVVAVAGEAGAQSRSFASATALAPDSTYSAPKSTSGALAQTDPALLGRTDSTPVNVLIKFDLDATASYQGTVAGLEATSPSVTGKKLKNKRKPCRHVGSTRRAYRTRSAQHQAALPNAKIETFHHGVRRRDGTCQLTRSATAQGAWSRGRPARQCSAAAGQCYAQFTGAWCLAAARGQDTASGVVVGIIGGHLARVSVVRGAQPAAASGGP